MTWRPPWWIAPVAVLVAVLAVVWALNRGRAATRELAREREERALELAGLNVAHQVERDALLNDLMGEAKASAALAEELARIQAAAPGARPIATAHGSTPWKPVGPAASLQPVAPPPAPPDGLASPAPATCPPCRLWVGDEVRIRASGAGLETAAGNYVVAAVASMWRRPPGDRGDGEKLHEEPLRLEVATLEAARLPGWGAGALLVGGRGGWWVGPAASPPPLRILGLDLAVLLAAGAGPGGEWGAAIGGLARW